jgi:hypothetical protein
MVIGNSPSFRVFSDGAYCLTMKVAGSPFPDRRPPVAQTQLVCSQCGSRNVDMVVTGTDRR